MTEMKKLILPKSVQAADPEHIARLKSVAKWRLPPEGSQDWIDFRLSSAAAERDPRYKKLMRETAKVSSATVYAVDNNGAGLPADAGVREFIRDYSWRTARHGLHYLPSSFNIFEAYSQYNPKYALFLPLPESDHICGLRGFLDYQASLTKAEQRGNIPVDNVILNYSFSEQPGELVLEDDSGKFVMSSVALVRHANEITAMCLGGVECDIAEETQRIRSVLPTLKQDPQKPDLEIDQSLAVEAVAFDRAANFQRAYFGLRYDIARRAVQARYALLDMGASWDILTDDSLTLDYAKILAGKPESNAWLDKVDRYRGIFGFLARLFDLPGYFEHRSNDVRVDKAITSLAESGAQSKERRRFERALKPQIVYERSVRTLLSSGAEPTSVLLPPFELKIEVEGFWEKLPFGTYGVGPDNERVLSKTWVRKTVSKRQAPMEPSSVSAHISPTRSVALKNEEGFIYVLRNAAHQIDIFKIGLTRRDVAVRAAELSRRTGIPDVFLTVQEWWVPDVVYAEKRIHQLLDDYRLKDAREFFRADYAAIRSVVELVVNELAGNSVPSK